MNQQELIPHLFRTEYRKIVAVLCKFLGVDHISTAEDIASDTFLSASELWGLKGLPAHPTAWLYTVAKNKTKDFLKHRSVFINKVSKELQHAAAQPEETELDWSVKNISDSQLAMMFVVCHPCNSPESQIGMVLNLLCGFGVTEIAHAFLASSELIYKRLQRAKQKLKEEHIKIEQPSVAAINERLPHVLMSIYLLFNEGYYSSCNDAGLRKELCEEAMRLMDLLLENGQTNTPAAYALQALMYFQSSRFDARRDKTGGPVLYEEQDSSLWDEEMMAKGSFYLALAAKGNDLSKYHIEAAIAYWHTQQADTRGKWESILQLYNALLTIEYSPVAALNRTYALAKVNGKEAAIAEAEKIQLQDNHLYHALLGELYQDVNNEAAMAHLQLAYKLARTSADKKLLDDKMRRLPMR